MSSNKIFVVVGSGPGIGVATASKFASEGFNIALLSRKADRLHEDAAKVKKAAKGGVKVQTFPADAGDHVALKKALDEVKQTMGSPEVVLYNVAQINPVGIGDVGPEYLINDFKLTNVGQYVTTTWALPLLTEVAKTSGTHPSILLSSTGIEHIPGAPLFSLFMNKAAQRNFLDALSTVAGPAGVHVARAEINGQVNDEDPVINAKHIAEELYRLSRQDKEEWQSTVSIGSVEEFVKKMTGGM